MADKYCSMIHGGLNLTFKNSTPLAGHCCLRDQKTFFPVDINTNFWNNANFESLRKTNLTNQWDPGCSNCQRLESAGEFSMRQGMNNGLNMVGQTQTSGPARIDLMFDISCNLACRTCGPGSSTFWIKQLGYPVKPSNSGQDVILALSKLDLSNLRQLVFCGGETLLGQEYWKVAEWLADNVPNAKEQLTLCFQTNGTQSILPKNYKIIEKFYLVKLHISIDGTNERFEYLRWPAVWESTVLNIFKIRELAPSNVMFVIEETVSIFNALYLTEVDHWVQTNFSSSREGDIVNHTKHLAVGQYCLNNMSQEYVNKLSNSSHGNLIPVNWHENPKEIKKMLAEIQKIDQQRNQNFKTIFPDVAECYQRFI
jgi:sulfatase maturation enzyme AslB (radical SAM superfamily)